MPDVNNAEATEDRNVPSRTAFDYVKHAGWVAVGLRDQILSLGMNQRIYAERAINTIAAQADEIERLTAEEQRVRGIVNRARDYVEDLARHGTIDQGAALEIDRYLRAWATT